MTRLRSGLAYAISPSSEARSITTAEPSYETLRDYGLVSGGGPYGANVTETTALNLTAIWSAVRYISDTIGMLPIYVVERVNETSRVRHYDHPVAAFLRDPCAQCPAFSVVQTMLVSANLHGNAIAPVQWNASREPIGIRFVDPRNVSIRWMDDHKVFPKNLVYEFPSLGIDHGSKSSPRRRSRLGPRFAPNDILHIRTFARPGGLKGVSPIRAAARTIALASAAEKYAFHVYAGGGKPPGVVNVEKTMSPEAYKRFREGLERILERQRTDPGSLNATPLILEDGASWSPWGISPEDTELLMTRRFEVEEVARLYRVPPHKIGSLEKSSFNNIEQQNIDAVTDSLQPWVTQLEQELTRKLIHPSERGRFFVRIDLDEILRGDFKARTEGYKNMKATGSITSDEIRAREDMDALANGMGSRPTLPVNVAPAPTAEQAEAIVEKMIEKGPTTNAPSEGSDQGGDNESQEE
tara:strand:- start:6474 stop:7877 length:1404 start_codon:yes stop_codon:yes gene_type:complete